uniref:RING-type E3 ubiquitin transferase n=1 Tax=Trichuris muris TaxID=70415 RepID=A0A5S6R0Y4_TRIMR
MADGRQGSTRNVLCHYFMNGQCARGSRCQFSHDRRDSPSTICRYFLRGRCVYGDGCRYDHAHVSWNHRRGKNDVAEPTNNHNVNSLTTAENAKSEGSPNDDIVDEQVTNFTRLRVDAPEFIPSAFRDKPCSSKSYADAIADGLAKEPVEEQIQMCGYFITGDCPWGDACPFVHGEVCELCQRPVLIPGNSELNAEHRRICLAEHEKEMEVAFTIARSAEMQCGICMDIVLEKPDESDCRFGILSNCKHCFCLRCIRTWRRSFDFGSQNTRACPECRVVSNFVVPSPFWVEADEEKRVLIESYKSSLKQRNCKYYCEQTHQECPFDSLDDDDNDSQFAEIVSLIGTDDILFSL